VLLALVV
jgi:hypothetical protein